MRSRYRLCKLCGDMHDLAAWPDNHRDLPPQRSHLSAPGVIRDGLDDLWHPSDGKLYDSKANFRKSTAAHGGIEVGNELQQDTRYVNTTSSAEVAEAMRMVEQGYRPHTEMADATDMASII